MSDDDDVKAKLAVEAGKAILKDATAQAKAKVAGASTSWKLKLVGGVVGVGVLAIVGVTLVAKLWAYAVGALIIGGAGFAGYLVVKPKVVALKQQAEQKLLAGRREREAEEAAQAAAAAAAAKQKALDDQLAAQKQKLEDELAALKRRT
jgi:hypothetical protein